jgi:hypothetical protein
VKRLICNLPIARHPHLAQVLGMSVTGGIAVAVFWAAEGPGAAGRTAAILAALIAFIELGRRHSDAVATISGVGDERTRALNARAMTACAHVMAYVLVAWWLVSVAQGHANETVGVLCAVFGLTYVLTAAFAAWRG